MFQERIWNQRDVALFPGFYESLISPDFYIEYERDAQEPGETPFDMTPEEIRAYLKNVSEDAVRYLQKIADEHFPDILKNMKLHHVYSPREYNFETDKLDVSCEVDTRKLRKRIFEELLEEFTTYLKEHWSSYDGFFSFVPTDPYKLLAKEFSTDIMLDFMFQRKEWFDPESYEMRLMEEAQGY